jgi:hypothetical protein
VHRPPGGAEFVAFGQEVAAVEMVLGPTATILRVFEDRHVVHRKDSQLNQMAIGELRDRILQRSPRTVFALAFKACRASSMVGRLGKCPSLTSVAASAWSWCRVEPARCT